MKNQLFVSCMKYSALSVGACVAMIFVASSCDYGGMRSSYPVRDNDPVLRTHVVQAMVIIHSIQAFKDANKRLPSVLEIEKLPGHVYLCSDITVQDGVMYPTTR